MKINVRILSLLVVTMFIVNVAMAKALQTATVENKDTTKNKKVEKKDTAKIKSQPANLWLPHLVNYLNLPMWSVSGSFGSSLFYGDTKQFPFFPMSNHYVKNTLIPNNDKQVPDTLKVGTNNTNKITERKWGGSFYLGKQFGSILAVRGSYMFGSLGGVSYKLDEYPSYAPVFDAFDNKIGSNPYYKYYSAYYFITRYHQFALDANLYLNSILFPGRANRLRFYLVAGIAELTWKPKVYDLKTGNQLNTDQTTINNLTTTEYPYANAKLRGCLIPEQKFHTTTFPIGFGLKYFCTSHIAAFFESTYKITRTDAIDGYSDAKTQYDGYFYTCIGISYTLGRMSDSLISTLLKPKYQLNKVKAATRSRLEARLDSIEKVVGVHGNKIADLEKGQKDIRDSLAVIQTRIVNQVSQQGGLNTMAFSATDVVSQLLVVFFDFAKTNILPKYHENIALVARILSDPKITIQIVGHADKKGSEKANTAISKKRAEVVANELKEKYGIEPERLTNIIVKGASDPLSKYYDDVNRRVDFIFTKEVKQQQQQPTK